MAQLGIRDPGERAPRFAIRERHESVSAIAAAIVSLRRHIDCTFSPGGPCLKG